MTRTPLATAITSLFGAMLVTSAPTLTTTTAQAQNYETSALREIARRKDREQRGLQAIEAGDKAQREKDYATAVSNFQFATDNIPNSANSQSAYRTALAGFTDASIKLAEQRIAEGRFQEAELLLKTVLEPRYNPGAKKVVKMLSQMETPGYYNRAMTPPFRNRVEDVKALLIDADDHYELGRYDLAFKRYEQVLNLDPYNKSARAGQEKVNRARSDYYIGAYNEQRARQIAMVDKAWGNPIRRFDKTRIEEERQIVAESPSARITAKLQKMVLPKLSFTDATIREAVDFLKKKSIELDPDKEGVNFVLRLEGGSGGAVPSDAAAAPAAAPVIPGLDPIPAAVPAAAPAAAGGGVNPNEIRITVSLSNIPMIEALKYVTSLANLKFKVEDYAVAIVPQTVDTSVLSTREFKVPPGFFAPTQNTAAPADPTAPAGTGQLTTGNLAGRVDAKDYLTQLGVQFGPNSSAFYLAPKARLIVKNTEENLDLIQQFIESFKQGGPQQVEIEAKFVEITQNNLKELSFDWTLGQANVPGSPGSVFVGGGTNGTGPRIDPADFPFVAPGNLQNPGGVVVGQNPITGGNRSGSVALSANAIDALLFGSPSASRLAPGIVGLSGVFTDPQFQVVMRGLDQRKGVDLLSAPRVTTKAGQRATIEIIREFKYPTEFEPPQIPQTFGNDNNQVVLNPLNPLAAPAPEVFPVTPTTPTAFEVRNTGVTLEVEPQVGADGYTIDLNMIPQVVEFEGFINYGSPIQTTGTNILGQTTTNIITPNVINQPIFSSRKVTTSVSVFDGQTVALGGLMREDVQKVEDKTPIIGDVPILGRLFRSNVDQHIKRSLVIFVTARLITATGEAVRPDEEEEDKVDPLPMPEVNIPSAGDLPLMSK